MLPLAHHYCMVAVCRRQSGGVLLSQEKCCLEVRGLRKSKGKTASLTCYGSRGVHFMGMEMAI